MLPGGPGTTGETAMPESHFVISFSIPLKVLFHDISDRNSSTLRP